MNELVERAINGVRNKTKQEIAEIAKKSAEKIFAWAKDVIGKVKASNFIVNLFCLIAVNDGKIRHIEKDLFNYVLGTDTDYEGFIDFCEEVNEQDQRYAIEGAVKNMDREAIVPVIVLMCCVSAIDGEIAEREIGLINQFYTGWERRHL